MISREGSLLSITNLKMTSVSKTFVIFKTFNKLLKTYFYYVRVNSFCEHPPPGANPGHLIHDEYGGRAFDS